MVARLSVKKPMKTKIWLYKIKKTTKSYSIAVGLVLYQCELERVERVSG